MYALHNYEFATLAYGGTLGVTFERNSLNNVNYPLLEEAFRQLQDQHPLLRRYQLPERAQFLTEYHLRENNSNVRVNANWNHQHLLPSEGVNANAAEVNYNDLVKGTDANHAFVKTSHPALMALMFPWLFPKCEGHYSLVERTLRQLVDEQGSEIIENHGGYAAATRFYTLIAYVKAQLLNQDRRFARDPSFLSWSMDQWKSKIFVLASVIQYDRMGEF